MPFNQKLQREYALAKIKAKAKEKPPKPIPKNIHSGLARFLSSKFGPDWRNAITYDQYEDWRENYQSNISKKQDKSHFNLVKRVNDKIEQRITNLTRGEWTDEEIMIYISKNGEMPRFNKNQEEIERLMRVQPRARELEIKSFTGSLSATELQELQTIYSSISKTTGLKAMKEGNSVVVNGKRYPIRPDGTVVINGVTYKIK